jgi:DNA-binding MarR family transcriptional regulator
VAELADREYQALARFRYALRKFLRFSEEAARAAGITPLQHQLLLAVRGFPSGLPSITDLAEQLQQRHHSVVELVDRAEAAGLVRRSTDRSDGRRHVVDLTETGNAALAGLYAANRAELRRFRREMSDLLRELD